MRGDSRTERSFYNLATAVFGQLFSFLLSFAIRTVFIHTLGEVYLGLNGLFTNILSFLNLSELGLGTAIVIELYRTVARNDEEKSRQYLALYRKAYYLIGSFILLSGLVVMLFLEHFINDRDSLEGIHYRWIFFLFLINTVFSYFFCAYRFSILSANQQEYKLRLVSYAFKILEMVLQIVLLLAFRSIYVFLGVPVLLGMLSTLLKGWLVGRWFPFVRERPSGRLSGGEIARTVRNIGAVAVYKISGCVNNSVGSVIVSTYVSIILVGVYSNYLIIISAVGTILEKVFTAFMAGLGNLNVEAGGDFAKKYRVFRTLSFLNFWGYGYCAVCMFVLFDPFIRLWIGEKYLLNPATEFVIVLNFLVSGLQETVGTHRGGYGLFYQGRYRPIASIVLNVVLAVCLVRTLPREYGVAAVLAGNILANLLITLWVDAWIVYGHCFHLRPWRFYATFAGRLAFCCLCALALRWCCGFILLPPPWKFLVSGVACTAAFHGLFVALFHRKEEFGYFRDNLRFLCRRSLGQSPA